MVSEDEGHFAIKWPLADNAREKIYSVIIGPRDFINEADYGCQASVNFFSCACGRFSTTGLPCGCMIIAQESRAEDPASLYPRWCTNVYHSFQYEGLEPIRILDKDDVEAAYQGRLESGDLQDSVLPPCIKPKQSGRPKKHQRFEDPARAQIVKTKRGRGQEFKKMQRKTQKAKKGIISGLAGVPSQQKGSGVEDEEDEEVDKADEEAAAALAQDQLDHEKENMEAELAANSVQEDTETELDANSVGAIPTLNIGDADVIDDGASNNKARARAGKRSNNKARARAGKRPAADPPGSSLRFPKKPDAGQLRKDGDQPVSMPHVVGDAQDPAVSQEASAASSWFPTTTSAKHSAQAKLQNLIDELINEQRDSVRVVATDKNFVEHKSPSDYLAGTAKVEHRQSNTYVVVEYDDGSTADSHEWGGDRRITSEIAVGYYLPANDQPTAIGSVLYPFGKSVLVAQPPSVAPSTSRRSFRREKPDANCSTTPSLLL
ncbi:hypothetical protein CTAYLR_004562 [Chrysophaeum taylorii]|uniref:SWIM-type domain-containing protein n=1 Tax=Chrysophaeum taylorii TaxID=2483200 RepID=A0AAD7UFT9_9STRA|nr:hypothetical protein CTAYLR_004562 [Chrysophaeum taylorii]